LIQRGRSSLRRPLSLAAIALLAAAFLFWYGSQPVSSGPAHGTALEKGVRTVFGKNSSDPFFRVATFNVHGGGGTDGRRELARGAETVAACRLDFVALQEVHGRHFGQARDQAADLAARLDMAWLFAPSERGRWWYGEFGNGLLSRIEAVYWQRTALPQQRARGYRNAVVVTLRHGRVDCRVLLTHITRNNETDRQAQLEFVLRMFLALDKPAILLGDLNTTGDDPQMRRLLSVAGVEDPLGKVLGRRAPSHIDWIVTRGLRCRDAGIFDNGASDHPLVWAEVAPDESSSPR
jgi:endonuclease/exonuclease/phosphatase family metal-dependent hydrolase